MATLKIHKKPKYRFIADIDIAYETDLTLVLQRTGESKAEFLRRVIKNEINMLEGNYHDIKLNPNLITESKLNEILSEIAYMKTRVESNEKHILYQGKVTQETKKAVIDQTQKAIEQTQLIVEHINRGTAVNNKQIAEGVRAMEKQVNADLNAFNNKVDKAVTVSYLVLKVIYRIQFFLVWLYRNVHNIPMSDIFKWGTEINDAATTAFNVKHTAMEREYEEGGYTQGIEFIRTEK